MGCSEPIPNPIFSPFIPEKKTQMNRGTFAADVHVVRKLHHQLEGRGSGVGEENGFVPSEGLAVPGRHWATSVVVCGQGESFPTKWFVAFGASKNHHHQIQFFLQILSFITFSSLFRPWRLIQKAGFFDIKLGWRLGVFLMMEPHVKVKIQQPGKVTQNGIFLDKQKYYEYEMHGKNKWFCDGDWCDPMALSKRLLKK